MTASQVYRSSKSCFLDLPVELQVACLGFAPDANGLSGALSTCTALNRLQIDAWKTFCARCWPRLAAVAQAAADEAHMSVCWRQIVSSADLMQAAVAATTDTAKVFNQHLTARRRAVLVEWLFEVADFCALDGSAAFLAVRLVDSFLASFPIDSLKILQLVGISCMRCVVQMSYGDRTQRDEEDAAHESKSPDPHQLRAVADSQEPASVRQRQTLDPVGASVSLASTVHADIPSQQQQRQKSVDTEAAAASDGAIASDARSAGQGQGQGRNVEAADLRSAAVSAEMCAGAYSPLQIKLMTQRVCDHVRRPGARHITAAPTARHFLRRLWWAAVKPPQPWPPAAAEGTTALAVVPPHLHTLALHLSGFLLRLSVLCPACCAAPPSHVAAAALSLALEALGLPPWPPVLRLVLPLRLDVDLQPLRERILAAQREQEVPNLRALTAAALDNAMPHHGGRERVEGLDGAESPPARGSSGGFDNHQAAADGGEARGVGGGPGGSAEGEVDLPMMEVGEEGVAIGGGGASGVGGADGSGGSEGVDLQHEAAVVERLRKHISKALRVPGTSLTPV